MIFCQSPLGALIVVGWTYRLMQRAALKQWWLVREHDVNITFQEFARSDSRFRGHETWPNWIVAQNFREQASVLNASPPRRCYRTLSLLATSLWENTRLGMQGLLNTWLLTWPGCLLMLFGWYDGWNNSFNKGYEQAVVGPGVSLLGIALLIAAMFYVPLAQARQSVTGDWKRFYDFRFIWTLVRREWFGCLGMVVLYSALMVPVSVLTFLPMYFPQINARLADASPAEAVGFLKTYYFWCALFVFPAYVFLRWLAARLYARAVVRAVQSGVIAEDALAEIEWQALHRLNRLEVIAPLPRPTLIRFFAWTGSRVGRAAGTVAMVAIWFFLVGQMYIAAFIQYRVAWTWLNNPLLQLPWFRHLPAPAYDVWNDVFATLFVLGMVLLVRAVLRRIMRVFTSGSRGLRSRGDHRVS